MSDSQLDPVVLLVDDEPLVLEQLKTELQDAGFKVVTASTGKDAALRIEANGCRDIIGLVTEVSLTAEPAGWDLARRARELSPALAVVYLTGGSGQVWDAKGVPHSTLITKPFAPAQLIVALAALMNAARSDD